MNHTQAEACEVCPPSYYCVNEVYPEPCPLGHACPGNTGYDWDPCPIGTYGPVEMLANISQCTQCDGGSYCNAQGLVNVTGPCDPGYWCLIGSASATPGDTATTG